MDSSVEQSRLIIATYSATTYNETLASNIPTIIFWDSNYWELNKISDPIFQKLKEVGIFHTSPESAARQVVKISNDIEKWWQDSELQRVRVEYCRSFAHRPRGLVNNIKMELVNQKNLVDF